MGATWVRQIDRTYDVAKMRDTLREALTTKAEGPKIIVASSECMLNKQRRVRPLFSKSVAAGERMVKERFGVDEAICSGDHACIRLSGCPSLSLKHTDDPLKDDPVAAVDNGCVGCGNCGEVADAAVLCPSFYRTEIIFNPSRWDRRLARFPRARHRLAAAAPRSPPDRLCLRHGVSGCDRVPFSLGEKVADEVDRMRELRREPSPGTLTPNPSPVGEGRRADE